MLLETGSSLSDQNINNLFRYQRYMIVLLFDMSGNVYYLSLRSIFVFVSLLILLCLVSRWVAGQLLVYDTVKNKILLLLHILLFSYGSDYYIKRAIRQPLGSANRYRCHNILKNPSNLI